MAKVKPYHNAKIERKRKGPALTKTGQAVKVLMDAKEKEKKNKTFGAKFEVRKPAAGRRG